MRVSEADGLGSSHACPHELGVLSNQTISDTRPPTPETIQDELVNQARRHENPPDTTSGPANEPVWPRELPSPAPG